jgi:group I intron endonuclease
MGVIYKIINKITGKIYIGKRMWGSEKFLQSSYYGSGAYIKRAVAKLGKDGFNREILEEIDDANVLSERERYWISYYKSNRKECGYNLSEGGENLPGFHHSDDTKRKIGIANSYALLGNVVSASTRKKISNASKGKTLSQIHKTKISEALNGKPKSELHNLHNSQSKIGKRHTEEQKLKIAVASQRWHDTVGFSQESINKMSVHARQRFSTPEERQKMSNRLRGHAVSAETRKKISETLKRKKLTTENNVV